MKTRAIIVGLCLLIAAPVWAQRRRGAGKVVTRTPSGDTVVTLETGIMQQHP